jgi:hypothetical protein
VWSDICVCLQDNNILQRKTTHAACILICPAAAARCQSASCCLVLGTGWRQEPLEPHVAALEPLHVG